MHIQETTALSVNGTDRPPRNRTAGAGFAFVAAARILGGRPFQPAIQSFENDFEMRSIVDPILEDRDLSRRQF